MDTIYQVLVKEPTDDFCYLGLTNGDSKYTHNIKSIRGGIGNPKIGWYRESDEQNLIIKCIDLEDLEENDFKANKIVKDERGNYRITSEKVEIKENFDFLEEGRARTNLDIFLREIISNKYFICEGSVLEKVSRDEYSVLYYSKKRIAE